MPKRTDLQKIMLIGSGPIVIGQACEFDYSGTQACKALREEGYEIILGYRNKIKVNKCDFLFFLFDSPFPSDISAEIEEEFSVWFEEEFSAEIEEEFDFLEFPKNIFLIF